MAVERLIVLVALTAVAVAVALLLQRRRPDAPSAPSYRGPAQLDRQDFDQPAIPFLAAVFASAGCNTCPEVWAMIEPLASPRLAVQRLDVEHDPAGLHRRYRIDGVPTTVVADDQGTVTHTFFGPIVPEALDDALAELGLDRPA